jgi:hypothetical protein
LKAWQAHCSSGTSASTQPLKTRWIDLHERPERLWKGEFGTRSLPKLFPPSAGARSRPGDAHEVLASSAKGAGLVSDQSTGDRAVGYIHMPWDTKTVIGTRKHSALSKIARREGRLHVHRLADPHPTFCR